MKGLSREHNKSRRRRENKMFVQVLRDPEKREHLIAEMLMGSGSPIRDIIRRPVEIKE